MKAKRSVNAASEIILLYNGSLLYILSKLLSLLLSQVMVTQLLRGGLSATYWDNRWLYGAPAVQRVDPEVGLRPAHDAVALSNLAHSGFGVKLAAYKRHINMVFERFAA